MMTQKLKKGQLVRHINPKVRDKCGIGMVQERENGVYVTIYWTRLQGTTPFWQDSDVGKVIEIVDNK